MLYKNKKLVKEMVNANPKISIIVPVYKAEPYLHRCIDSILAQTFTDWELLLIDDGSPDSSGEICDEYASRDSRIQVFHKENGGVSSARNMGLDSMRGEYVTFVDADDCLYVDALEVFMAHIVKYDLDFAQCEFNRIFDEKNRGQDGCSDVLTAEEYIKKKFLSVCVWGGSLNPL